MKWQLQEAKAKLSELIRRVDAEGPQIITVRGAKEYVLVAREAWDRRAANDGGEEKKTVFDIFQPVWGLGVELELPPREVDPERGNPFEEGPA